MYDSDTLDYDCDPAGSLEGFEEAYQAGRDRAARHSVMSTLEKDDDRVHPEEVRRRTLRGPQMARLRDFVACEADQATPGGLAIAVCVGAAETAYAGRPGKGDAEWAILLTAPAILWLRRHKSALKAALGGSGEGLRLVERLFE